MFSSLDLLDFSLQLLDLSILAIIDTLLLGFRMFLLHLVQ